jgi:hypothetical protein
LKLSDMKKGYAQMNAGVWVGDIPLPLFDGVRLKVARLWNPAYSALHDKLSEGKPDPLPDDVAKAITDECLLTTCLSGWDGVEDAFTADAGAALLADPDAGPVFRSALIYAATHVADQVKAQIEADEKN